MNRKPKRVSKKVKCVEDGTEYTHMGCVCRAICPKCGKKGSSVLIRRDGKIFY